MLILNLHVLLFHYCLKYPSRCSHQSISFPAIQASPVFQLAPHTCPCSGLWEREHCTHFTYMKQTQRHLMASSRTHLGCPGGSAGKESACKAGDLGSIPGLGRSPGEGKGYPLQHSGVENSMDYTAHGVPNSRTQLSNFHFKDTPWIYGRPRTQTQAA